MPENAADYINQIETSAAEAEAEKGKTKYKPRRSKGPLLTGLTVLLLASTTVNVVLANAAKQPFSVTDAEVDALSDLLLAVEAVEEYREEVQEYPPNLETIDADAEGVTYRRLSGGYQVQTHIGNETVSVSGGADISRIEHRLRALTQ